MRQISLLFLLVFSIQIGLAQSVFYVKIDGNGIGDSWENASDDLSWVLEKAQFGDQIWVAAGTYKPTKGTNRFATFQIPDGVELYGGFKGFEQKIKQRFAQEHSTVLSGEIGMPSNSDNSFSVVTTKNASDKTIIDGFVITGGNANMEKQIGDARSSGGGWYNLGEVGRSNPTIRNTLFFENSAKTGGAFFNAGIRGIASPNFFNCFFVENQAGFAGGAVYNLVDEKGIASPKFILCILDGNRADYGGGICNFAKSGDCAPVVTNSKIQNNSTQFDGAFMKNMKKNGTINSKIKDTIQFNNQDNLPDSNVAISMDIR